MKAFWLNDSLTLQAETNEERKALGLILDALQRGPSGTEGPCLNAGNSEQSASKLVDVDH